MLHRTFLLLGTALLAAPAPAAEPLRLATAADHATYRRYLPRLPLSPARTVVEDPNTVFYTEKEMPRAYQQGGTVHSPYYNIAIPGRDQFGNGLREFPWNKTAGLHRTDAAFTIKFFRLPTRADGSIWPIVHHSNRRGTISWTFPVGTVVGEIMYLAGPDRYARTFELRTRTRDAKGWSINVYRPYASAEELAEAVTELFPTSNPQLDALKEQLRRPAKAPATMLIDNNHFRPAFQSVAWEDKLPAIPAAAVDTLLNVEFKSALEAPWRADDEHAPAAPTTDADFHIVPKQYAAGFMEVSRASCLRCHQDTNQPVDNFTPNPPRDWYGALPGSDGILSFHIFDPSCISGNGSNVAVRYRHELAAQGMLETFHPQRHPLAMYTKPNGID